MHPLLLTKKALLTITKVTPKPSYKLTYILVKYQAEKGKV